MATSRTETTSVRLADDVYRRLREDILSGRLRPRDHLVEVDLAERLQVSRTPVRESLHRLAADGLIVSRRRRWVVHEHSLEEIREIYEVRMALEGYAARLACRRAGPDQVAVLECLLHEPPRPAAGDREWFVDVNTRFHGLITAAADNAHFARLAESNRVYTVNTQLAAHYTDADVAASQDEHRRLVRAIRDGDPDTAEALARSHVEHALRLILESSV